jgi:hypothetical protein
MTTANAMPGPDEVRLTPPGDTLCHARGHRERGVPAQMTVTFGQMGTRHKDALWHELWGRAFPMCTACWQATHAIITRHRPTATILDTRPPPPGSG